MSQSEVYVTFEARAAIEAKVEEVNRTVDRELFGGPGWEAPASGEEGRTVSEGFDLEEFRAFLAEAEAEGDEHVCIALPLCREVLHLLDALAAAREENGRLRESLLKRGRHTPECSWLSCIQAGQHGHDAMARMVRDGCPPCDCGWETERAALAREATDADR